MLRRVHIRIIPAEGHKEDQYTYKAPPNLFYRIEDEEKVCDRVVEFLDKKYPWWNFRMVKVGPGRYNFVYDGLREGWNAKSVDRQEPSGDVSKMQPPEIS